MLYQWIRKSAVLFALLFVVTGCSKEVLFQDLNERDANEILVALYNKGVEAQKVRIEGAQEVSYKVQVPKNKIDLARQILVENNLPKRTELGFSGICKEKGLIPTPEEEKCRKLLALKGEIINSLERVPGVIDADVVLNIPEVSEFANDEAAAKRPTASAVLQVKKDVAGYEVRESQMQRFISNTVENLDPRDVAVIISYVESPEVALSKGPQGEKIEGDQVSNTMPGLASIAGLQLTPESMKRFKIYAVVFLLLLIAVSVALVLNVFKVTRMRQEIKVSRAQGGMGSLGMGLLEDGFSGGAPQLRPGEESPPQDLS